MTEQHPLTDEIIQAITHNIHVYDDTRPLRVDMRAAADWQLEQVIKHIQKEDEVYADYIYSWMRPLQQQEGN